MSGAEIAAEVDAAYAEVARDVGANAYTVTLTQILNPPQNPSDPAGAPVPTTLNALEIMIKVDQIDGTLIQMGDRMIDVSAVAVTPRPGDKVEVQGLTYNVMAVTPLAPSGVALKYRLQLRT